MDSAHTQAVTGWPKVDLHRHLEGSVRLETAWAWAQQSPALAETSLEELRSEIQFDGRPDFAHFLSKFRTLRELYHDPRAIVQVAREAVADAAHDGVRYLELRFSPDHFARQAGYDPLRAAEMVLDAANAEAARHPILVRFLCTIGRAYDWPTAHRILSIALSLRSHGIVGIDLAGNEIEDPVPAFAALLGQAADAGLGISVHAGEVGPAEHVWQAIDHFHATRIGHGIRSVDDPRLMETLAERDIPLEVCPTSNLHTGAVPAAAAHPLARLVRAGVPVALSSDDPSISGITLSDEYRFALNEGGLSRRELAELVINAARHAFLPPAERASLRATLSDALSGDGGQPAPPDTGEQGSGTT